MAASHIQSQFETDELNRKTVWARLGTAATLPDEITDLYALHQAATADQLPDAAAEVAAALYVYCRKHLHPNGISTSVKLPGVAALTASTTR